LAHFSVFLRSNNCLWWLCLQKYRDNDHRTQNTCSAVKLYNITILHHNGTDVFITLQYTALHSMNPEFAQWL
jgi:hypothetical protein